MNNKDQFKSWILNNLTEKSGAGLSYISSLDWLSDKFYENGRIEKKSIYEIEDIDLITQLHLEVKKIQRDKNSIIYNKNAPSYGERYFYSASLSKYKEFLQFKNGDSVNKKSAKQTIINDSKFEINLFNESVFESGLVFSEKLIARFVASLLTKPFVLLTGLSGSGKTKIAQSFVKWICEDENQYKIIPVGADWTNREPLLGYPNGLNANEYVSPDSGALDLIIESAKKENQHKPYFMILDEMNLSHVERYFADFLSVMESDNEINLYSGSLRKDLEGNEIPKEIFWSINLFIIGTVNIDETTYMFSPKVLDRANTIEFRVDEAHIKSFFDLPSKIDLSVLETKGTSMGKNFLEIANDNSVEKDDEYTSILVEFFNELKKVGAEFGYRTAVEMLLLIKKLQIISDVNKNESIDIAVMQKLLPKLHGSRSKISKVLDALILLCLKDGQTFSIAKSDEVLPENILYPIALEKLVRMYKNALDNGFTSYAEA
jgi:5-methylcytosine-specific restriction protein B